MVLLDLQRRIAISTTLPRLLNSLADSRGRPLLELIRDFAVKHPGNPANATTEAVEWLLREHFRHLLASMLPKEALETLLTNGCKGIPTVVLQGHGLRSGPSQGACQQEWKALADPHIHWASAQAKRRLPTKAPESAEFRAEVASWLKRAAKDRLLPGLRAGAAQ